MSVYNQGHTGRGELILNGDSSIGTLFGHRVWQIAEDGWLIGDYVHAKWTPGVNVAKCYQTIIAMAGNQPVFQTGTRGPAYDFSSVEPTILEGWEPAPCGGIARNDHGCGFYVRTRSRYTSNFPHIRGVVEAWGDVEFGSEGFRAEKARIVALLKPDMGVRTMTDIAIKQGETRHLRKALREIESHWLDEAGIELLEQMEGELVTKQRIINQLTLPMKAWPAVKSRYKGVELFTDEAEMLRAYPPTDLTSFIGEAS